MKLIERNRGARQGFGCSADDPLRHVRATLKGPQVRTITNIVGAELIELRDGIATIKMDKAGTLRVPTLRLTEGMVARIHVNRPRIDKERRFVHVAQLSGGQLLGGVSLELLARKK